MKRDPQSRIFGLYDVLALTHGLPRLSAVFRANLEYLAGVKLTGTAPVGAVQPCREWLLEQHPALRDVPEPPDFHGDMAAAERWANDQCRRLKAIGFVVRPMPLDRQTQLPANLVRNPTVHTT